MHFRRMIDPVRIAVVSKSPTSDHRCREPNIRIDKQPPAALRENDMLEQDGGGVAPPRQSEPSDAECRIKNNAGRSDGNDFRAARLSAAANRSVCRRSRLAHNRTVPSARSGGVELRNRVVPVRGRCYVRKAHPFRRAVARRRSVPLPSWPSRCFPCPDPEAAIAGSAATCGGSATGVHRVPGCQ